VTADREDWPVHQPAAPEAPIPGRHWYSGCNPDRPRVRPDGICEDCGERACPECGREECGECDAFLFPDKPWKHSFACAIHDDEPCTCKAAA
jgi:hypothetical protein